MDVRLTAVCAAVFQEAPVTMCKQWRCSNRDNSVGIVAVHGLNQWRHVILSPLQLPDRLSGPLVGTEGESAAA
jgi:hypothetical protein